MGEETAYYNTIKGYAAYDESAMFGYYTGIIGDSSNKDKIDLLSNSFGILYNVPFSDGISVLGFSLGQTNTYGSYTIKLYTQLNKWSATSILINNGTYLSVANFYPSVTSFPGYFLYNYAILLTIDLRSDYLYYNSAVMREVNYGSGEKLNNYIGNSSYSELLTTSYVWKLFNNYSLKKCNILVFNSGYENDYIVLFTVNCGNNTNFKVHSYTIGVGSDSTSEAEYSIVYRDFPGWTYTNDYSIISFSLIYKTSNRIVLLAKLFDIKSNNARGFDFAIYVGNSYPYSNLIFGDKWSSYHNIPFAIASIVGGNYWVSPDLKWWFFMNAGEADVFGKCGKGIRAVYSSSALFGVNGWTEASYEIDGAKMTDFISACSDYYVLDMIFNKNGNKIIVLCNSQMGHFSEFKGSYRTGIQPDLILFFMLTKNKWVNLTVESVGAKIMWTRYTSSGNKYSSFNVINNNEINFMYPGGHMSPYSGYRYYLTFDD